MKKKLLKFKSFLTSKAKKIKEEVFELARESERELARESEREKKRNFGG